MTEIKLNALGLREVRFGDRDYYLTALTEEGRKIEIRCKSAQRGNNQSTAAHQLCYTEFVLSQRNEKYTLREAELIHSFFGLTKDIVRYALACYLIQLTLSLADSIESNMAFCRLLLYALYMLETGKREPALVKAAFEWRMMAESGYRPELSCCGVCQEAVKGLPTFFSVSSATAAHEHCVQRVGGDWCKLHRNAIRALLYVLRSEPKKVYAFRLTGSAQNQFCTLAEQYALYHLERGFNSLDFYHSLTKQQGAVK